ncbi:hypothetical protein POF50_017520 [Streptomyces sp. SL13]|uniref:Uncharacterized protein n=1 Tax=Streptantibioticus silvisoli TaxID=2705255 RepID=A0AA90H537_9ACTN|nr:hypothetical protein [Streptantibioticus silvisoli]MDI5971123.1 hypothetical protein [Streptantibioticus silvisoli]
MNAYVPSREFVNSLGSWSWLEQTGIGPLAFVLLALHDSPVATPALNGLADLLTLGTSRHDVPDCGRRVGLLGERRAALRVDRCRHVIQVAVGSRWSEFVRGGGRVAVLVGLAPLRTGAGRPEVGSYLANSVLADELRMGTAGLLSRASR